MDKLQLVKDWLEGFPEWNHAQWGVALQRESPVSACLTLEDDRVLRQKEDVLGKLALSMQAQFSLTRVSYHEENPSAWVEAFTNWALTQSALGAAPCLGDGATGFRLEKGKLEQKGAMAVYTVRLIGTYEKILR